MFANGRNDIVGLSVYYFVVVVGQGVSYPIGLQDSVRPRLPVSVHTLKLDAPGRTMEDLHHAELPETFHYQTNRADVDTLMHIRQGGREWKTAKGSRQTR
jgi:hypothetical protein